MTDLEKARDMLHGTVSSECSTAVVHGGAQAPVAAAGDTRALPLYSQYLETINEVWSANAI
jgi:hypothetical protein